MENVILNGVYGEYKILEHESIMVSPYNSVLDLFFNNIEDVKRYIYYRYCNKLKDIDDSLYEAITILESSKIKRCS